MLPCRPRILTPEQAERAARLRAQVAPAGADGDSEAPVLLSPSAGRAVAGRIGAGLARPGAGSPRLALVAATRWPAGQVLTVQFLDGPSAALQRRILAHLNAWQGCTGIRFVATAATGMVRIARTSSPPGAPEMAGHWSYLGTEILGIADGEPTMNLDGFTYRTPEAEFRRVVRHEAGHTLGFDHEHLRPELVQRIDPRKAVAYYRRTEGWTAEQTRAQVLTPLEASQLVTTTEADTLSVMCYHVPGDITRDGRPIAGGSDIQARDRAFARQVYRQRPPG